MKLSHAGNNEINLHRLYTKQANSQQVPKKTMHSDSQSGNKKFTQRSTKKNFLMRCLQEKQLMCQDLNSNWFACAQVKFISHQFWASIFSNPPVFPLSFQFQVKAYVDPSRNSYSTQGAIQSHTILKLYEPSVDGEKLYSAHHTLTFPLLPPKSV